MIERSGGAGQPISLISLDISSRKPPTSTQSCKWGSTSPVLLFAISLCACGNSQLNDNNVNNENKQEKFELKGKWYGQEDHCIEFLDDENAIFNCEDIKDYQLKYIYNEDLNTIELKWTMSLNIEIKNDNGTYYLYLGMRDEVYVKESDKDYANTAYTKGKQYYFRYFEKRSDKSY